MSHQTHSAVAHRMLSSKKSKKNVTRAVYVFGIAGGNLAVIPQITKAWQSNAPGLAVSSWILFIFFGLIWLVYAIQQRQKPLIIAQVMGICVNIAVVSGWFFNNYMR